MDCSSAACRIRIVGQYVTEVTTIRIRQGTSHGCLVEEERMGMSDVPLAAYSSRVVTIQFLVEAADVSDGVHARVADI